MATTRLLPPIAVSVRRRRFFRFELGSHKMKKLILISVVLLLSPQIAHAEDVWRCASSEKGGKISISKLVKRGDIYSHYGAKGEKYQDFKVLADNDRGVVLTRGSAGIGGAGMFASIVMYIDRKTNGFTRITNFLAPGDEPEIGLSGVYTGTCTKE
jgi:hypothetical protein